MIYINGHDLTIEQVIAVSREGETVAIAPEAVERINAARAYVDRKLAEKAVVYGLTTGFGKFSTVFVPEEETAELQRNLIISHACGMGRPLPARVVRAAMLLRLMSAPVHRHLAMCALARAGHTAQRLGERSPSR